MARVGEHDAATWKLEKRTPCRAKLSMCGVAISPPNAPTSLNPQSSATSTTMFGRAGGGGGGRAARRGWATARRGARAAHARSQGCRRLRTEASQLSRPLLERKGWQVEAEETACYAGVDFQSWRMIKELT